MIQRRGRPSFSKDDEERLFAYMDVTRYLTISYGSAYGYHSPQYALSTSLSGAIDKLAEQLTGNPQFFWASGHSAGPPSPHEDGPRQGRSASCAGASCGANISDVQPLMLYESCGVFDLLMVSFAKPRKP